MHFECTYEKHAGAVVVTPLGDVDRDTAPRLREVLTEAVNGAGDLPVDVSLRHVTFMDSSGIGALLAGHRAATARGVPYAIKETPPSVRAILEITNVWELLTATGDHPS